MKLISPGLMKLAWLSTTNHRKNHQNSKNFRNNWNPLIRKLTLATAFTNLSVHAQNRMWLQWSCFMYVELKSFPDSSWKQKTYSRAKKLSPPSILIVKLFIFLRNKALLFNINIIYNKIVSFLNFKDNLIYSISLVCSELIM